MRNFFEEAVRQSPSSVVITDADGNIEYVNPKFEALTGYSLDEVRGKNPRVLNSGYRQPEETRRMWQTLLTGTTWRGEFRNKKKNGDLYWESASISPLTDNSGQITHYMAIKEDITAQKEAEIELRKLTKAVEQSPASIVITNTDGDIEYVNPKFERLTGYTLREVEGKNPRILQSGEKSPEEYRDMWNVITSGGEWHGEFHNRKKSGELYWEYASISPVIDEKQRILYFLAVKEDVTAQKELEFSLREALETIEAQRDQMTDNLEHARRTQRRLLPQSITPQGVFSFDARYEAAEHIGGDYYDVVPLGGDRAAVVLADVTGHGVSAALISSLLASEFRHALQAEPDPAGVLLRVNEGLAGVVSSDRFASAILAILDTGSGHVHYAVAGHPDGLLLRAATGRVERLTTDGFLLGLIPSGDGLFESATVTLEAGDKLLLYSDAYSEAAGADGEQLGVGGLANLWEETRPETLEALHKRILAMTPGTRFEDDATLVLISRVT